MINTGSLYFLFLFLAFFSINDLVINPVYVLGVFCIFLTIPLIRFNALNKLTVFSFLFFILTSFNFILGFYFQDFYYKEISPLYVSSILFGYSILLGTLFYEVGLRTNLEQRKRVYFLLNRSLIFFMILELITRLMNPDYSEISFYKYKDSVLYYDSNFTGIVLCVFLMFFVFLKKHKIYDIGSFSFFAYILFLLLTISRASIVAFFVSYICVVLFGRYFKYFAVLIMVALSYFSFKMINIYLSGDSFVDIDGSFNSKFYIISQAIDLYGDLPFLLKFFGIGLANFSKYAGIFAHNIVVTFIFELGIFGSLLFLGFFIYLYFKTKGAVLYILMPILVGGFSLFSAYSAFLFVLSAAVWVEVNSFKQRGQK